MRNWLSNSRPIQERNSPSTARRRSIRIRWTRRSARWRAPDSIAGQVPGTTAVHTASDIPLSAYGRGAAQFTGAMDNTDVFFKLMRAVVGGADTTVAER
jgi:alkaline phosphatase